VPAPSEAPRPELARPPAAGRAAAAAAGCCSLASLASAKLALVMALSVLALAVAPGGSATEMSHRQDMTVLVSHVRANRQWKTRDICSEANCRGAIRFDFAFSPRQVGPIFYEEPSYRSHKAAVLAWALFATRGVLEHFRNGGRRRSRDANDHTGARGRTAPSPPTTSRAPCSPPCHRGSPRPGCVLSPCALARPPVCAYEAEGRSGFWCVGNSPGAERWQ
jgi:hypothetical protein